MKTGVMTMTIMMKMTMILIEIIVIICNDDEGGHADENNDGDRGKSAERAMFKVWYSFLSMSLLGKLLKIQHYIKYPLTALKGSEKASGYVIWNK